MSEMDQSLESRSGNYNNRATQQPMEHGDDDDAEDDVDIYGDLDDEFDKRHDRVSPANGIQSRKELTLSGRPTTALSVPTHPQEKPGTEEFKLAEDLIVEKQLMDLKKRSEHLTAKLKLYATRGMALEKENRILKANISSLYKTAKAEIERKDSIIADLRQELDDLKFRRNRHHSPAPSSSHSSSSHHHHHRRHKPHS